MKKLAIIAVLIGVTTMSFAQGTVLWNNSGTTLITIDTDGSGPNAPVSLPANNPVSPTTSFSFGLFIAPFGTAAPTPGLASLNDANWQFVGAYGVNSTAASGAGRMQNPGTATIAGFAAGSTVNFIVRGWQSTTGAGNWENAKAGLVFYGHSALGYLVLGGGAIGNQSAWGTTDSPTLRQISGLTLQPVPEPSSMALAGLGAASLLIFRRRK